MPPDVSTTALTTKMVKAAVQCGFDPFHGPVLGLRLIRPGEHELEDSTLLWLIKYLLGDATLCVDRELVRLTSALQLEQPVTKNLEARWNWKIFMLPEIKCAVIALLFTDDRSETNMVQALVVDHDEHGAMLAKCGPQIATLLITSVHQRFRYENPEEYPNDALLDYFAMSLNLEQTQEGVEDLFELSLVADDLLAGGATVNYSPLSKRLEPWCADITKSVFAEPSCKAEDEWLFYEFLCARSVLIIGSHRDNVVKWLHTAAFLIASRHRRFSTLSVRSGLPVSTLTLQGVLYNSSDRLGHLSKQKMLDCVRAWITKPLVLDADLKRIELGGVRNGQNDAGEGLFKSFMNAIRRVREPSEERRVRQVYSIINGTRRELDLLGKRFAVVKQDMKDLPTLSPIDARMIVAAAHPSDVDKVYSHVQSYTVVEMFKI